MEQHSSYCRRNRMFARSVQEPRQGRIFFTEEDASSFPWQFREYHSVNLDIGNYFKHRDEWSNEVWQDIKTHNKSVKRSRATRIAAQKLGVTRRSTCNMRSAIEKLGISKYSEIIKLADAVDDWAAAIHDEATATRRSKKAGSNSPSPQGGSKNSSGAENFSGGIDALSAGGMPLPEICFGGFGFGRRRGSTLEGR